MHRVYLFVLCVGVALMSLPAAAGIVVLTEEPVAEFTLPDGSVLKNAFVWKRNSEGLMIIHDEGQYYLNFRTLPDTWRAAYAVMDEIGQVPAVATERDDQYLIFDIIPLIDGLHHQAVTFYKSKRYPRDVDDALLTACALQCFLDQPVKAKRICRDIARDYSDYPPIDVEALYESCVDCDATGYTIRVCATCNASGKCGKCDGAGELESEFKNADPKHCTTCRGTGSCTRCNGKTKLKLKCDGCKGYGKNLRHAKVKAKLAVEVEKLNRYHADFGQ